MNWYGTSNTGSQAPAGNRASDTDSMCGNAVLYDAVGGNILTVGGAPAYVGKCTFSYNINNPTLPFSSTFARVILRFESPSLPPFSLSLHFIPSLT